MLAATTSLGRTRRAESGRQDVPGQDLGSPHADLPANPES